LARARNRRAIVTSAVAVLGTLGRSASAPAAPTTPVANGYYATVEVAHVPGGEDVEFTLADHADLVGLSLTCLPDAADAKLIATSGCDHILNVASVKWVALRSGHFDYSGTAKVTAGYAGAPKVATATLSIKGYVVRNGPVYHYTGTIGNKVTATLVFEGTATSSACTGLPANHLFRLYSAVS
jgi:hypothetical protein